MTCTAKTRSGGQCGRGAGWGTSHPGVGRCKLHGGSAPQAEVAGVVALARQEALVMGHALDMHPREALLQCIRIAAGEVAYASDRIAELEESEAVAPLITRRVQQSAEDRITTVEMGEPRLHVWIVVRQRAMDRLVNFSKIALASGIEDQRLRLAEEQGRLVAQVIRGVLTDLGVADRPDVSTVVRRHLTLAAAPPP